MWRVQDANGAKWLAFACLYTRHASPRRPLIAREGVLRHTILRSTVPKDWQACHGYRCIRSPPSALQLSPVRARHLLKYVVYVKQGTKRLLTLGLGCSYLLFRTTILGTAITKPSHYLAASPRSRYKLGSSPKRWAMSTITLTLSRSPLANWHSGGRSGPSPQALPAWVK